MFSRSDGEGRFRGPGLKLEFSFRSPRVRRVGVDLTLPGLGVGVCLRLSVFLVGSSGVITTTESCLVIVACFRCNRRSLRCWDDLAGSPRDRVGTIDACRYWLLTRTSISSSAPAMSDQIESGNSGDFGRESRDTERESRDTGRAFGDFEREFRETGRASGDCDR